AARLRLRLHRVLRADAHAGGGGGGVERRRGPGLTAAAAHPVSRSPSRAAASTACVRDSTSSLRKIAARCVLTVDSDRSSSRQIVLFGLPSISRRSTSR